MRALGIDPDLTTCPWALVSTDSRFVQPEHGGPIVEDTSPRLEAVGVFLASKRSRGRPIVAALGSATFPHAAVAAIESMQVYSGHASKVPTRDLLDLQQVVGAAAAAMQRQWIPALTATPAEWKGQVSKARHQELIREELGFEGDFSAVEGADEVRKGDWKHIWDAAGLALYALRKAALAEMIDRDTRRSIGYRGAKLSPPSVSC